MGLQPAPGKSLEASEFKPDFPSEHRGGVFEIQLARMGDMREPVVIRASIDLGRQYAAEGPQWVAEEGWEYFAAGDRIPTHRVAGWREIKEN